MKHKIILFLFILFIGLPVFAQQNAEYEAFFKKLLETGIKPEELAKMNQEQVIAYAKAHNIAAPGIATTPNSAETKPANSTTTKAPAAVPPILTVPFIEAAVDLPNTLEGFTSDGFANKLKDYKSFIDTKKLSIEQEQNKIAAADAKAGYPAVGGGEAEVSALKKILAYQQNSDGSGDALRALGDQKTALVKEVGEKMKILVAKEHAYLEKMNASNNNAIDLAPFKEEAQKLKAATYVRCQGLFRDYKIWYIKDIAKTDAILNEINFGTNMRGLNVRAGARSLQNVFYGYSLELIDLRRQFSELLATIDLSN